MDPLEQKLKTLVLKRPSPDLKQRIFGQQRKPISLFELFHQPIELRWAFAFSLIMGILGYFAAEFQIRPAQQQPAPNITYEIHLQNPIPNNQPAFDMTTTANKFLSGDLSVTTTNKEI